MIVDGARQGEPRRRRAYVPRNNPERPEPTNSHDRRQMNMVKEALKEILDKIAKYAFDVEREFQNAYPQLYNKLDGSDLHTYVCYRVEDYCYDRTPAYIANVGKEFREKSDIFDDLFDEMNRAFTDEIDALNERYAAFNN